MNTTEKAMNKSGKEIEEMYDVLKESIRCFLSRMLIDNEQGNPLKCSYVFGDREAFGLGELQKLHVDKMCQTNEGLIWIHFEGCDEESWSEIDEFSVDDLVDFIHQIEYCEINPYENMDEDEYTAFMEQGGDWEG